MTRQEILQTLTDTFKNDITSICDKSAKRFYAEIKSEALIPVVQFLFIEKGARFNIASGIDCRNHFEIVYHFTIDEIDLVISLRVHLDKNNPQIASLTSIMKGASWIEREMSELLGITFVGHPDMRRLLLSDEWPQGVFPLRRDYQEWDKDAVRDRGVSS